MIDYSHIEANINRNRTQARFHLKEAKWGLGGIVGGSVMVEAVDIARPVTVPYVIAMGACTLYQVVENYRNNVHADRLEEVMVQHQLQETSGQSSQLFDQDA